ncbi:CLUMA_CG021542, isoform A [Clunio marinus]|uniref:CLUMA_CG021542, isoform A n=1 Tax=Clunio marinus TaxID=568069 RepID=A0A1J1J961_9DIPT|nr:CLUMA_CG021542, isoform A [Clunio marinus]
MEYQNCPLRQTHNDDELKDFGIIFVFNNVINFLHPLVEGNVAVEAEKENFVSSDNVLISL